MIITLCIILYIIGGIFTYHLSNALIDKCVDKDEIAVTKLASVLFIYGWPIHIFMIICVWVLYILSRLWIIINEYINNHITNWIN